MAGDISCVRRVGRAGKHTIGTPNPAGVERATAVEGLRLSAMSTKQVAYGSLKRFRESRGFFRERKFDPVVIESSSPPLALAQTQTRGHDTRLFFVFPRNSFRSTTSSSNHTP